jgi:YHS domain-containing protein
MTTIPNRGGLSFAHNGITYHFCGAGCRRAFETNPDAYLKAVPR